MHHRILWIEDDYYAIKGLVRPLEKAGFTVEAATAAYDGYVRAQQWPAYDLIVVDLILPLSNDTRVLPDRVALWRDEEYAGVGLLKWLLLELRAKCPVILLSVVRHPTQTYHLENIGLAGYLPKRGLLPSQVKAEVYRLLGLDDSYTYGG